MRHPTPPGQDTGRVVAGSRPDSQHHVGEPVDLVQARGRRVEEELGDAGVFEPLGRLADALSERSAPSATASAYGPR